MKLFNFRSSLIVALWVASTLLAGSVFAAEHLSGQVQGGGAPIVNSAVTLWEK